jgi:NADH:ubiquinone oxidoreductase subunit F (NADH-binding)
MNGRDEARRLLRGVRGGAMVHLSEHLSAHGPLPVAGPDAGARILDGVRRSGLRGRGGAHVPTALKLDAVAAGRRRAVVVANGAESEPASHKDAVLLAYAPHLVIDGAVAAAAATGAGEAILYVKPSDPRAWEAVSVALSERRGRDAGGPEIRVAPAPDGYVIGQETAVIAALNGRAPLPSTVPPRPHERGVRNRPTLVCNVETLAHIALIARHGPEWFRLLGSPSQPGTALVTLGGAAGRPGVYEIAYGSRLADLVRSAGGLVDQPRALLVGGYGGAWLDAGRMRDLTLSEGDPLLATGSIGAGVLWVLAERSCGVSESARILGYLAAESAGQCGPCVFGLRAIADTFDLLARGRAGVSEHERLLRWSGDVTGRGACRHPDGAARFLASAMKVFAQEIDEHRAGRCTAAGGAPSMPLPNAYRMAA